MSVYISVTSAIHSPVRCFVVCVCVLILSVCHLRFQAFFPVHTIPIVIEHRYGKHTRTHTHTHWIQKKINAHSMSSIDSPDVSHIEHLKQQSQTHSIPLIIIYSTINGWQAGLRKEPSATTASLARLKLNERGKKSSAAAQQIPSVPNEKRVRFTDWMIEKIKTPPNVCITVWGATAFFIGEKLSVAVNRVFGLIEKKIADMCHTFGK